MRDNYWLNQRLNQIWALLFPDTPRPNKVIARFKGKSMNKFGHIKLIKNDDTEIAINSLFKSYLVPEYIIDLTLAHELVHYSHGFHSPLPKLHKHPHKGGIVDKELLRRGFGHLLNQEKDFVRNEWPGIYKQLNPNYKRRQPRKISLFRLFRI